MRVEAQGDFDREYANGAVECFGVKWCRRVDVDVGVVIGLRVGNSPNLKICLKNRPICWKRKR